MKTYSIGRDVNCNIVINDNTDVISRRHAVLNVDSSGKMTIVDQSRNGTYVNGMRIAENVPVPVTRKDNVSFAHVARLDWNMVPKTYSPLMYVGIALLVALLAVGAYFGIKALNGGNNEQSPEKPIADTVKTIVLTPEQVKHREDSIRDVMLKEIKDEQEKQRVKDSIDQETAKKIEKQRQDSLRDAKADSIARAKKEKDKQRQKQKQTKPQPQPKEPKDTTKTHKEI